MWWSGCEGNAARSVDVGAMEPSFHDFLALFQADKPLDRWDTDAQRPLVIHDEILRTDKTPLRKALAQNYTPIPTRLVKYLPTHNLAQFDIRDMEPIASPDGAYDFYAYAKVKRRDFWLVSIFAYKHTKEDAHYHVHPFLLATYSEDGRLIDDFVWWYIIADDIEFWHSVRVNEDTLVIGYRDDNEDGPLQQINEKIVITDHGYFESIFQDYPEGRIIDTHLGD
jgi:hypothetical protein